MISSATFHSAMHLLVRVMVAGALMQSAHGQAVTYEAFGAVGDGKADDLPAIVRAHEHANQKGLPVRSTPGATYHLGTQALTAIIATDTDWNTSQFIIDDSQPVANDRRPLFDVRSLLKPVRLKIESLKRGQTRLDTRPPVDCLVYVENNQRRIFIRRGLNANNGSIQKEVFILKRDGTIEGGIDWDYEQITRVEAQPINETTLHLRGGIFTHIANRTDSRENSGYVARNILIGRSRTVVEGLTHRVTGEGDVGRPYSGFLNVSRCAKVVLRNCVVDGRKTFRKASKSGPPVAMGTYGYSANLVVDLRMIGCKQGNDIHDRTRWGVMGTNFMKNFLIEDCVLSRADVHQGVSGAFVIRRTTLGHAGLNAIGRGRLLVEDSTLHGRHLVSFRSDYGSTWDGEVEIRNSRWLPPGGGAAEPVMFGMQNNGTHDFGYLCSMPRVVTIDGLTIEDAGGPKRYRGVAVFSSPFSGEVAKMPFPYRLAEKVEIRGLKAASGLPPRVSDNEAVTKAVRLRIRE